MDPCSKKIWRSIVQPSPTAEHSAPRKYRFEGTAQETSKPIAPTTSKALVRRRAKRRGCRPMTYTVNGEQYVAVSPGGAASFLWPEVKSLSLPVGRKISPLARLQTKQQKPAYRHFRNSPRRNSTTKVHRQCVTVKKVRPYFNVLPPLPWRRRRQWRRPPRSAHSATLDNDQWFVRAEGQLKQAGMVSSTKNLSHDDAAPSVLTYLPRQSILAPDDHLRDKKIAGLSLVRSRGGAAKKN